MHNLSEVVDKEIGLVFENIDPYIILRILAENQANNDLDVFWSYADIVDNGWVRREEIFEKVGFGQDILFVTEGIVRYLYTEKSNTVTIFRYF